MNGSADRSASDFPPRRVGGVAGFFRGLRADSPWMAAAGWAMVAYTVLAVAGVVLDPATVDGNPAWLKPLKFGISTCIFAFTTAFVLGRMERWPRVVVWLGRLMAVALVIEIGLIDMQAARHVTSHFNTSTRFDAGVYSAMGMMIFVVLSCTIVLLVMASLERFADKALASAIRIGLVASLVGMGTGVLMTLPTPAQLTEKTQSGFPTRSGAHSVGAPDGGARMLLTGWSADHGDLRIAHFVGLHCMQGGLLGWWLTRRRERWTERKQVYLVRTIGWSFLGLWGLLLWQALRGQPLLRPDAMTWIGWGIWLTTAVACLLPVVLSKTGENAVAGGVQA